jgi:hypothetical protein
VFGDSVGVDDCTHLGFVASQWIKHDGFYCVGTSINLCKLYDLSDTRGCFIIIYFCYVKCLHVWFYSFIHVYILLRLFPHPMNLYSVWIYGK